MAYSLQVRYLGRVLLLLAALLVLWWTVLLGPLLGALRLSTEIAFRIFLGANPAPQVSIDPEGNWLMRVPVPKPVARRDEIQRLFGRTSANSPYVNVRSLTVVVPGRDSALFLVSVPLYCSIVLAAGWRRRAALRPLAAGTCVQFGMAVVLMSFLVVRAFIANTHIEVGQFANVLLDSAEMAVLNVLPYLVPVLLALVLDRDLRALILSTEIAAAGATAPLVAPAKRRSVRGRRWAKAAR